VLETAMTDYATVGLSHEHHPMAFHRAALGKRGVFSSRELPHQRAGRWVDVAGVVICRQRPESANGVFFMSLEDEYGMTNVVVMPDLFDAHRVMLTTAPVLVVTGILELDQNVFSVLAKRFAPLEVTRPVS